MPNNIDTRRLEWLKIAKSITTATIARTDLIRSGCVTTSITDDDDKNNDRKAIDKLSRLIMLDLFQLSNIEAATPNLGARAALGQPPSKCIQHAFVMMAAARLSGEASREVNLVSDVIDHVGARNPDVALEIRMAFRHDGRLRPSVWITKADVIDQSRIQLREDAFNKALALQPDVEFDSLKGESRRMGR